MQSLLGKREAIKIMTVYSKRIELASNGSRVTYHEITSQVRQAVEESKISNGICVVASPHTTCSVIFEEFVHDRNYYGDEYIQVDLNNIMERIVPRCVTENQYHHPGPLHTKFAEELIHDSRACILNTDAHLRASFFGCSETFVITNREIQLGEYGYIYFVDWDQQRVRKRNCLIQIMGE